MPSGHKPSAVAVAPEWSLEGITLDAKGQRRPVRLELDRSSGCIAGVADPDGRADIVLDDEGLLILPGFLDVHVHCRDDPGGSQRYKEDFGSASAAALHGGVVLVGDMPNNPVPPVDAESYARKRAGVEERARVDVMLYGAVTPERGPFSDRVPYKCYYGPSGGDLHLESDAEQSPLARYRDHFVSFHAESHEVLEASRDAPTHEERRPAEAERRAIAEITELSREYGFHAHIAHLSSAAGLEEVRRARKGGVAMTCEVAPHHLFFDVENRSRHARGEWLQMNPPLRTPEDRRALLDGLRSGEIDLIATDHAPHSLDENRKGISGVPLLDTFAPFLALLEQEQGLAWDLLVERAAAAPARLFERFTPGRFGSLQAGGVASLTVLDTGASWEVRAEAVSTHARWSPFEGVTLPARVAWTVVRGQPFEMV